MKLRSSRFSPRLVEPELLEQLTVAREPLLGRLVASLSAAIVSGQGRFDLLVGPRGVGKSHMLGLVEARVRALVDLRERLVVVSLPEEFSPSSLLHLLARVLEELPADPAMPPVSAQRRALRGREPSEALEMVVAMIRARLGGRSLLLMLENLDTLFKDLGRKAQAQLRKIVQSEQGWSIFATARTAIALTKQTEPFHGTFVVEQLEAMSPAQSREMMLRLARVHERPKLARRLETEDALMHVRAAHHLVGGSPRVVAMLFHHLDPERLDDLEGNFYRLAEELTPYFQDQMSRLSPGQRPVMEFLAERWAPASVSEIAEATFNEPTTVSTHLRALRRDRLVRSLAVGKERFYEIADPLHRVARAMKQDRRLAAALARMARVWALLGGKSEGGESASGWSPEFSEPNSEYVDRLLDDINTQITQSNTLNLSEDVMDALLRTATGHQRGIEASFYLLHSGRDSEAAMLLESADKSEKNTLAMAGLYIVWLGTSHRGQRAPRSEEILARALGEANPEIFAARLEENPRLLGSALWRAVARTEAAAALKLLRAYANIIPSPYIIVAAIVAWARGETDFYLESAMALEKVEPAKLDRGTAELLLLLSSLENLEAAVASAPTSAPRHIQTAIRNAHTCIPWWIASGRSIPALREALRRHADLADLDPTLELALASDDNARAFSRLGAEARAFTRDMLHKLGLDDLLAKLPPEPSEDPD